MPGRKETKEPYEYFDIAKTASLCYDTVFPKEKKHDSTPLRTSTMSYQEKLQSQAPRDKLASPYILLLQGMVTKDKITQP